MITGIHFLLTYKCNFECEHCFLFSGPHAKGTFTIAGIRDALRQIAAVESITSVCFEGGEPCLYHPVMAEGIRLAAEQGLSTGIVTNAYWATSVEDAELWLRPLVEAGLGSMSVSDDALHFGEMDETPAKRAVAAAGRLGLKAGAICTESPSAEGGKLSGGVMFRGRAVEKMAEGLPRRPAPELAECPHEDLAGPGRVHLDPFGNLHLCQGLLMGNILEAPLAEIVAGYDAGRHPVCGPLVRGGPAELAKEYGTGHGGSYVDECHFCYELRKALVDRFPKHLGPRQVYGLEE